jgi:hypothetical protein
VSVKFANIFHCKTLQEFTQIWDFWFENTPSGNPGHTVDIRKQTDKEVKAGHASFRYLTFCEEQKTVKQKNLTNCFPSTF